MSYIYELGYGTYEESEKAQLVHQRKFSQKRFEQMVIACTVEAARMERDLHLKRWNEDSDIHHVHQKEDTVQKKTEKKSYRMYEIQSAMQNRLKGEEYSYHSHMADAVFMGNPCLTYQELHGLVVHLMCQNYGFKPIEKLRTAYFFGWSDLAILNDWEDDCGDKSAITRRASRLVRKLVWKSSSRWRGNSVESRWSKARDKALCKNPASCDTSDEALCKEIGIEFIPYNHPDAIKAREEKLLEDKENKFASLEAELLDAFGKEENNA